VLDSYFLLTKKSNLIDRLSYDLIRFFDYLVGAYFFRPPCRWICNKIHKSGTNSRYSRSPGDCRVYCNTLCADQ